MNCRDFESGLEALPRVGSRERDGLERHAEGCGSCAELLELARLPEARAEESADFTNGVLVRTTGAACRQAESSLPELVDGLLPSGTDRELLAGHLEHCETCSSLRSELERLALDLPRLAIVRPERSLVEGVMRRTLPLSVRLRRWWAATWPQWVRRPRFASELAYIATLLLVVLFGTPVSPLQAMPGRAVELARTVPLDRLESLPTEAGEEVVARWQAVAAKGTARAETLAGAARETAGTILDEVASWFVTADEESPAEPKQEKEETS